MVFFLGNLLDNQAEGVRTFDHQFVGRLVVEGRVACRHTTPHCDTFTTTGGCVVASLWTHDEDT